MIVPGSPQPPIIGIEYFDINTFMGQILGWLKWLTLIGLFFAAVAFIIAAYFISSTPEDFLLKGKSQNPGSLFCGEFSLPPLPKLEKYLGFMNGQMPG